MRVLVSIFLLALVVVSCGPAPQIKVGLSLPNRSDKRWVMDREQLRRAASDLSIDLLERIGENNGARQMAQCDELISQGISVLILAPVDGATGTAIVDLAKKSHVAVIAYDTLILGAAVDLYIAFDQEEVGRIQARYLVEKLPLGNFALLSSPPTDLFGAQLITGAMEILTPLVQEGKIRIGYEGALEDLTSAQGFALTKKMIQSGIRPEGILAPTDEVAGGVIQALAQFKLQNAVVVTGQGSEATAVTRIKEGLQSMTVLEDTRKLGALAMESAVILAKKGVLEKVNRKVPNGKIAVPSILLAPQLVTQDNYQALLFDTGYLREDPQN